MRGSSTLAATCALVLACGGLIGLHLELYGHNPALILGLVWGASALFYAGMDMPLLRFAAIFAALWTSFVTLQDAGLGGFLSVPAVCCLLPLGLAAAGRFPPRGAAAGRPGLHPHARPALAAPAAALSAASDARSARRLACRHTADPEPGPADPATAAAPEPGLPAPGRIRRRCSGSAAWLVRLPAGMPACRKPPVRQPGRDSLSGYRS